MGRKARKYIIAGLFMMLLTFGAIELLLRYGDPWGGIRYYSDLSRQLASFVEAERGFMMYPGLYEFSNWSALINLDGSRYTPASKSADCDIVFVGDSLTWGFGVNDQHVFVNHIAGEIDAHVVNAGLSAYNSEQVLMAIETMDADGFVYVIINNDDEVTVQRTNDLPVTPAPLLLNRAAASVYLDFAAKTGGGAATDEQRFEHDLRQIAARGDVLMAIFEDVRGWHERVAAIVPEVIVLPPYTARISVVDPHPNAVGHQQIAANLLPHVKALESEVCQ
jgi:hypothetical protein